jgi:hypothetical protein
MRSELLNGGAYCRSAFVAINKTATAAGSGDNTEVDGAVIDRKHPTEGGLAMSAKLMLPFTTTLGGAETLKFAVQVQSGALADGSDMADYGTGIATTTVATGDSGGSTETGVAEVDIDLSGAGRYVRVQPTPNLSASGTDTAEWAAIMALFGDSRQPSSLKIGNVGSPI